MYFSFVHESGSMRRAPIAQQARIQKLMEGGAERIAREARAKFLATAPTQRLYLTEIQRFSRQECLQSPRVAPSAYTNTCINTCRIEL